jgi:general secretion pathway protein A
MLALLELWGVAPVAEFERPPCRTAEAQGLRCLSGQGTWNNLRHYNRPAVIRLHPDLGQSVFAVVQHLDPTHVTLFFDGRTARVPITEVDPYWFGEYTLLWRPPAPGVTLITSDAPVELTQWLGNGIAHTLDPESDPKAGHEIPVAELTRQIREFQQTHGLKPDGIAGVDTLIHLNTALELPGIPRLTESY